VAHAERRGGNKKGREKSEGRGRRKGGQGKEMKGSGVETVHPQKFSKVGAYA